MRRGTQPGRCGRQKIRLATLWATCLAFVLCALPAAASASPTPGAAQLQLVSTHRVDARLTDLTFRTPALPASNSTFSTVRVMLPSGYDPGRRYPVLYLLHGGAGKYSDWTTAGLGDAEAETAGLPLIVVMPDAGAGGWYTDWYNNGAFGTPEWETYHIDQVIPWFDGHYPTVANRGGRAIAGLSMGGFGAMSYAARHPDLFVSASSFSGAVDINQPNPIAASRVLDAIAMLDGGVPGSLFGLRANNDVRWRAHNPWDLAVNLRGLSLALHTGNGQAGGPYGGGGPTEVPPFEVLVHPENVSLHQRLIALGIPHVFDDYGPGGHDWPYWNRDLRETLPTIMATFAHPPPPPSPFTFTAVEPSYQAYGWSVSIQRRALEFSTLSDAHAHGFTVAGSGTATVTTAPLYQAGHAYDVSERGSFGAERHAQRADSGGRLTIKLPLGPANLLQEQFTFVGDGQPLPTTRVFTSTVAISAVPAQGGHGQPGGHGRGRHGRRGSSGGSCARRASRHRHLARNAVSCSRPRHGTRGRGHAGRRPGQPRFTG